MDELYKKVLGANQKRSFRALPRRIMKLAEELGELNEAYLNVTSEQNGKGKNWHDVREEIIDLLIVSLDCLQTRLPIDEGKPNLELQKEYEKILDKKLKKWDCSKTSKTDAIGEE